MRQNKTIAFIGTGNMGGALLGAVLEKLSPEEVLVSDRRPEMTARWAEAGCSVVGAAEAASGADYLVIGVKPQAAAALFDEIRPALAIREGGPVFVTMMAGRSMQDVRSLAGGEVPVIRIMPNVAASVGEAMILCDSVGVSEEQKRTFEDLFEKSGRLDWLPETLIDAAASISGCGPAFVCLFVEALADGAVKCGLPRQKATEYAIQTILGTAKLLQTTGAHPAAVKDAVTSPGGTTIEGIRALEKNRFRYAVMQAVVRSFEKNSRL